MAEIVVTNLKKTYPNGGLVFEALDLTVKEGEFLVILGPSGCGKSTLLKCIAGIEPTDSGTICLDTTDITRMRPGERDIAMVFQDYALYPHMSVSDNLAFSLKSRRMAKDQIRQRVADTAAALGIADLLERKPTALSGGQRQRVALGRAMIRDPQAYLMDEPLSNLDAALRTQMRSELVRFHRRTGGTVVYVTHDQIEAMTMGHRIAVMRAGEFQQIDVPQEVYRRPRSRFVAEFLGSPRMNILPCVTSPGEGVALAEQPAASAAITSAPAAEHVGFRPEHVRLADPERRAPSSLEMSVTHTFTEHLGNELIVHCTLAGRPEREILARLGADQEHRLPPEGQDMAVAADAGGLHLFDGEGVTVWHGCDHAGTQTPAVTP